MNLYKLLYEGYSYIYDGYNEEVVTFDDPKEALEDIINNIKEAKVDFSELLLILRDSNTPYKIINLIDGTPAHVYIKYGDGYITDDVKDIVELEKAEGWFYDIDPVDYIEIDPFSNFWDYPSPLYHITPIENIDSIFNNGLNAADKTRGLGNQSVGHAVFATSDYEEIDVLLDSYGDTIIKIDTDSMKRDGYTPQVSAEPQVIEYESTLALAHLIGIDDPIVDLEQGISPNTIIIYGSIPPQYLFIIE